MKTSFLTLILTFIISFVAFGQEKKNKLPKKAEVNITVYGNCGMCENRIEKALDVKGVHFADWDRYTKTLLVRYNPRQISEDELHKLVAGVGHDTEKVKADTAVYQKLPGCCLYRENPNTHSD